MNRGSLPGQTHRFEPKMGVLMHIFTFWCEKIILITMQGNGLSMDVGNPKKNEDLPCIQSGGKSKFGSLAMAFPLRISRRRVLLSRKMCSLYQLEFLVFFYFSRQTKSNLGKIASYTSHNFFHLTISLPLSLILREGGCHELPSFSLLFFCGYWQENKSLIS